MSVNVITSDLMMPVAFFSDRHMLPGLHVSLLSLLDSLSQDASKQVVLYLFLDNVSDSEQQNLVKTYLVNPKQTKLCIESFSPKAPLGANRLHGSSTAYGRLSLPFLLSEFNRCLYLDCDLVVNRCIGEIFSQFDGDNVILANVEGVRKFSVDKKLYKLACLDMDRQCFNSGVLGIDLGLWRQRGISTVCREISEAYSGEFLSADQALLNVALASSFKRLGDEFNTMLFPGAPRVSLLEPRIYHFVGSPKPWDPFGLLLSNHFSMWKGIFNRTSISSSCYLRYSSVSRFLSISRRLAHEAKKKLAGLFFSD